MSTQRNSLPRARRVGLNVQIMGQEVLLFDAIHETAHALNGPAAFVWQHADGTRTVDDIARAMSREFGAPADAQVVWYALEQLKKRQLLEMNSRVPIQWQGMTRRQFLTRVTAGAALLAVVTTIVVPSPAHAQSVACLPEHALCADQPLPCCDPFECIVGVNPTCEPPPPP